MHRLLSAIAIILLMVTTCWGQSIWKPIGPFPASEIFDVQHITAQDVVAVGFHGAFIRSNDGGRSWKMGDLGHSRKIYSVSFYDNDHGTVVGDSGWIQRTTNGGQTWIKVPAPDSSAWGYVRFMDDHIGFMLGSTYDLKPLFLKTSNGGVSWDSYEYPGMAPVSYIHIVNATVGWLVANDGQVWITTDKGSNWTLRQCGTEDLTFVVAGDANRVVVGTREKAYRSTDGGLNWTSTSWPASYARICWTDPYIYVATTLSKFARSSDLGVTWTETQAEWIERLWGISFADSLHGVVTGERGSILYTDDGGKTYTNRNVLNANLVAVHALNDNFIVALGEGGTFLRTNDGGKQWRLDTLPYPGLLNVRFLNESFGVIVGDDAAIFLTTDGGESWKSHKHINDMKRLHAVDIVDESTICVVGDSGSFGKTTDGGTTWKFHRMDFDQDLRCVRFSDSDHGIAAGSNFFFRTTDGGVAWTKFNIGEGYSMPFAIWLDSLHVVASTNYDIKVMTDGVAFMDVKQLASPLAGLEYHSGILTGVLIDRSVIISRDSGKSWVEIHDGRSEGVFKDLFDQESMRAASVTSTGLCVAVGPSGEIAALSIAGATGHLQDWQGTHRGTNGINTYPNPAHETLTISAPYRIKSVNIYDMFGVMIQHHEIGDTTSDASISIHLSGLQIGTYVVSAYGDDTSGSMLFQVE